MPIFKIYSVDGAHQAIVRAKCMDCAREVAVQNSGSEGTLIWRDPSKSTVELVRPDGSPELIMKTEAAPDEQSE